MKSLRRQQGQAIVEFAIVLPLFFFLVCVILEFGVFLFDYLSVNEIAREMARTMAVSSNNTTTITKLNARLAGMNTVQVQINLASDTTATVSANVDTVMSQMTHVSQYSVNENSAVVNGDIQVTVKAYPRFIIPLISQFIPATISSGIIVMRIES